MKLETLLASLSRPEAFPEAAGVNRSDDITVVQTHCSMVFLTPTDVYKLKKPVDFGFLDYSTLEKRKHFCEEEVRINRRLAPAVYRGVLPVVERDGEAWLHGDGEVVDHAVHMERLPDDRSLESLLANDAVPDALWDRIARSLAQFHRDAPRSKKSREFGTFDVIAHNARENFEQTESHVGVTVSRAVYDRVVAATESELAARRELIEARLEQDLPCPTHGDLRLDHIYSLPDREPPHDLPVIDAIEFNERFRYSDPVSDLAFLLMDLRFRGRHHEADRLETTYFEGDTTLGADLVPFYVAYRAVVRGKVEGLQLVENEVPADTKPQLTERARAHWLLALGQLSPRGEEPRLVLMGGLPATGKSTVARAFADERNFEVIRSDVVRKELFLPDEDPTGNHSAPTGEGIYTPERTEKTYAECARRAKEALADGGRVIIDATFHSAASRAPFLELGRTHCVPVDFVVCTAPEAVLLERLRSRTGDASDADESVYRAIAAKWEPPSDAEGFARTTEVDTTTDWQSRLSRH